LRIGRPDRPQALDRLHVDVLRGLEELLAERPRAVDRERQHARKRAEAESDHEDEGEHDVRHRPAEFEQPVRGATVLGFVGAGGIGQDLMEAIRKFYYSDVSAIPVLIIAVVMTIDISTQYLRRALLSERC
jgi:hypothetical protein